MQGNQQKIPVHELQIGMYVSNLDRPWCETPFPIQGFYIRSADEVKSLESYCKHVYVDVVSAKKQAYEKHAVMGGSGYSGASSRETGASVLKLPPLKIRNRVKYPDIASGKTVSSLKKEVSKVGKLQRNVSVALTNIFETIHSGGTPVYKDVSKAVDGMVESVIRNPDALVWLTRVNTHDQFSYQHAISASIWALVLGRYLGLEKEVLKQLSTAVLLSQVGKAKLPKEVLEHQHTLNAEAFEHYKKYVEYSVEILESSGNVANAVIDVVRCHRERHNGTGFPNGITGDRIPLLAKIAGLVDAYQEMIEPRPGVQPAPAAVAVSKLYESRNIEFQEELVESFIKAIGVYPTGTLVELNSQEVGIVLNHNPKRRLWPKVAVVLNGDKKPLKQAKIIDLLAYNEGKGQKEALNISGSLPAGAYDIDPSNYLITGATSRWSWRHFSS
ncbi:HD-GYP domain-containing protein [Alkalimarinus coralli]|uniref:HD-GYP domain-containing protein n=1 Tax=Alkalimarinus coralli TaxID=2935863 RepID=UPI00202B6FC8|nr:HD-GYP domain-containing protein [Alkalimarinus coralli]